MKTFKDLQVGDKVFLGFYSYYVQNTSYINGYLVLVLTEKVSHFRNWPGHSYYIPLNHLNANQVKTKHGQLMLNVRTYRKFINKFINRQINK